jgi:hypothetical protein
VIVKQVVWIVCMVLLLHAVNAVADGLVLKLQWPQGVTFVQEVESCQQMRMDSPSFPETVEQEGRQRMVFECGAVEEQGNENERRLEVRVRAVELELDAAGRSVHYDSNSGMSDEKSPFAQLFKTLRQQTFSFTVNTAGQITAFSGDEPLQELIRQQAPQVRAVLEKQFGRSVGLFAYAGEECGLSVVAAEGC